MVVIQDSDPLRGAPADPGGLPDYPGCCHDDPVYQCENFKFGTQKTEPVLIRMCNTNRCSFGLQPLLNELIHEVREIWIGASYISGDWTSFLDHLLFAD